MARGYQSAPSLDAFVFGEIILNRNSEVQIVRLVESMGRTRHHQYWREATLRLMQMDLLHHVA